MGQNIHNLDGTNQTKSQWVKVGNAATYQIQIVNNEPGGNPASVQDDFLIKGPGSDAKWTVTYFDANGQNITAQVTGAGYTITALPVGSSYMLSVEVAPNQGVADGDTKDVLVTATIVSDLQQQDVMLAATSSSIKTIRKLHYRLGGKATWLNGLSEHSSCGKPIQIMIKLVAFVRLPSP